jgi:hypothetical protein
MFLWVTASFGRQMRASSSMLISPRLNLANHFSTVDFAGAESECRECCWRENNFYQGKRWLQQYFFRQKAMLHFINTQNFSIFS